MANTIEVLLDESILIVRINRPEKKNALTPDMYMALARELRRADADEAIRVVLITGGGECFTAGNDLADFMNTPPSGADSPVMQFLMTVSSVKKPLVAAVNGVAVGVGVTMLLHCDLVVAAEDAYFQMPFVNLGLCAEAGSTLLMPQMMGWQRAAELLLLGEPFSAGQAWQCGLVNRVTTAEAVQDEARALAKKLASRPTRAVQSTKELMRGGSAAAVQAAIAEEGRCFARLLQGAEAREAFSAFMERRQPDFSRI